ncbi:DMT family transporter [Sphingomonas montanisoli]|uniref:DMT family transporter n=1 Tax=Sphingomonas montanisoli TaxID=2606412 RepID=A0A5D9CC84_9SPHN|nr:DMT family transporter [Sphingomonas montanisoli]TZG28742.1 DMT family transporter [Sphingomonas montanisoli]
MSNEHSHNLRGIMLRCGAVVCFAIMSAAMKWASADHVSAIEMLFFRSAIGLPVVVAWLLLGPGIGIIRTKRPKAHLIRSMIGMSGILMNFQALIMLPLADVTTIGFSAPIFATILSALVLKEHVGGHRWSAVALGFIGVAIVVRPGGGEVLSHVGIAAALLGAIGTAGVTVTIRQIGSTEEPGTIVFWFFVASAIVSGSMLPFFGSVHSLETYGVLAISGVAGAFAQILMTMSLKAAPVSVVSPFDYGQIIWASLLGWLLWSTAPGTNTLVGAGLIVCAGLYTAWRESRKRRLTIAATPPLE